MRSSGSMTAPSACGSPPSARLRAARHQLRSRRGAPAPRGLDCRCRARRRAARRDRCSITRRGDPDDRRQTDGLDDFAGRLATHSERHESLLARGYVVVRDGALRVLTEAAAIKPGEGLELEFYDGKVNVIAGRIDRIRCAALHRAPNREACFNALFEWCD